MRKIVSNKEVATLAHALLIDPSRAKPDMTDEALSAFVFDIAQVIANHFDGVITGSATVGSQQADSPVQVMVEHDGKTPLTDSVWLAYDDHGWSELFDEQDITEPSEFSTAAIRYEHEQVVRDSLLERDYHGQITLRGTAVGGRFRGEPRYDVVVTEDCTGTVDVALTLSGVKGYKKIADGICKGVSVQLSIDAMQPSIALRDAFGDAISITSVAHDGVFSVIGRDYAVELSVPGGTGVAHQRLVKVHNLSAPQ
jgi:hypothetical protein